MSSKKIKGNFNCSNNKLVDLKWCPIEVDWRFNCSGNPLISLKWASKKIRSKIIWKTLISKSDKIYDSELDEIYWKIILQSLGIEKDK